MNLTEKTLFAVALVLVVLNFAVPLLCAFRGSAFVGLEEVTLVLTGIFAIAGATIGLARGLRRGKARRKAAL